MLWAHPAFCDAHQHTSRASPTCVKYWRVVLIRHHTSNSKPLRHVCSTVDHRIKDFTSKIYDQSYVVPKDWDAKVGVHISPSLIIHKFLAGGYQESVARWWQDGVCCLPVVCCSGFAQVPRNGLHNACLYGHAMLFDGAVRSTGPSVLLAMLCCSWHMLTCTCSPDHERLACQGMSGQHHAGVCVCMEALVQAHLVPDPQHLAHCNRAASTWWLTPTVWWMRRGCSRC